MTGASLPLDAWLQDLAGRIVREGGDPPHGAVIRLEAPTLGFAGSVVAGVATAAGEPLTPDHPFHVASIGKLFTAVLVLQLSETGALGAAGVDARLADLGVLEPALLDRLHVLHGVSRGADLTIRQLLTHTAGLADAFGDDANGTAERHGRPAPNGLSAGFWRALKARRNGETPASPDLVTKVWTAWNPAQADDRWAGLLNYYLAELGAAPAAAPGERFHYSDQAFVLLALIIERLSGRPYAAVQRDRILAPLGLDRTWMNIDEAPRGPRPACDVWMNGVSAMAWGANLSFDWGGGGQVSTVGDLCRFLDGLLSGALFSRPGTLAAMTDWVTPPGLAPPRTALGLGLQAWASPASGAVMIGHAGAWGARLWRDPRTGATVAGTVNQRDPGAWAFEVLDEVWRRTSAPGQRVAASDPMTIQKEARS
jgi:D-alanyl-D-alanine carboxypeptidase